MLRVWIALLTILLVGCPKAPMLLTPTAAGSSMDGRVQWDEKYQVQATTSDIAQAATVSLIDPTSGSTVASTVTKSDGTFSLALKKWTPQTNTPYLLEAVKGLPVGGLANRAGAATARMRTVLSYNSGWQSLTAGTLTISRSTTALSVIASLKSLNTAQYLALLNQVTPGSPDTFTATANVTSTEYSQVWGLVDAAITRDQDPLRVIARNVSTGSFLRLERGALVTDLSATLGVVGTNLVLYGHGFDATGANNIVRFNGTAAASVSVNATLDQLTVTIPAAGTPGPLTLQVGNLVTAVGTFTVRQPVGQNIETYAGARMPAPGTQATNWAVNTPSGTVIDGSGNLYYAAYYGNQVYKRAPDGTVAVVAGTGTGKQLNNPGGLAVDGSGNLYIADVSGHRIQKLDTNGSFTTVAGNGLWGYTGDGGTATTAQMTGAEGVAVDAGGNLYIADTFNQRIRKVDTSGIITTVAGSGTGGYAGDGGAATAAKLNNPWGVAVDGSGNLYIADWSNNRIRKVATNGTITTVAGNGTGGYTGDGGPATNAQLYAPTCVAVDALGNLYIADQANHRVRKVDTSGTITTVAGTGLMGYSGDGAAATAAQLNNPDGVTVDAGGTLYIAEWGNHRIRKVATSGTISTFAGTGASSYSGDGTAATGAQLDNPYGMATDGSGNLYFADSFNQRIRKVATNGTITTVAGNGTQGYSGDNGPATAAQLSGPWGVAVDAAGNLYFADSNNNRIRKVSTSGTITTVAGTGTWGYSGDNGPATAANMGSTCGVALDAAGNLYIDDYDNCVIRKVGTNGIITTVAGTGTWGYSGDNGPATAAKLNFPVGVAVDASGNVYIADYSNNRIRKVDTNGTITTFAGTGAGSYSGDGGAATAAALSGPRGLALDSAGNLYIADYYNYAIRKVGTNGIITTVAGNGLWGYAGDGGPATSALLSRPNGVATDGSGNLFIADTWNCVIRRVF